MAMRRLHLAPTTRVMARRLGPTVGKAQGVSTQGSPELESELGPLGMWGGVPHGHWAQPHAGQRPAPVTVSNLTERQNWVLDLSYGYRATQTHITSAGV